MKSSLIILFTIVCIHRLDAQGISDWFQQKKEDLEYLGNQIAALQVYISDVEKGYKVVQDGLKVIGEIKNGEFNLHSIFFSSLKSINPAVAKYSKVADIIYYEAGITNECKKVRRYKNLNSSELKYLKSVFANLSDKGLAMLDELINLITDNNYEMKDNERLRRIEIIYSEVKDGYAFARSFGGKASLLSSQREVESGEIDLIKKLW